MKKNMILIVKILEKLLLKNIKEILLLVLILKGSKKDKVQKLNQKV